ncbi:MAG: hypothetical protein JAY64_15520, partial [Candidatus Thiodiazotropha weberae]|nr:hypothetical protein [Candidatus Thiodiazotropha lotti]MCW4212565.1 hypothetical protein [Candidatus Thiodiazotropha lotti]
MLLFENLHQPEAKRQHSYNNDNLNMNKPNTDYIGLDVADTLAGVFQERVRRTPEDIAFIQYEPNRDQWQKSTWHEMAQQVALWQAALKKEALKPGDRVALM